MRAILMATVALQVLASTAFAQTTPNQPPTPEATQPVLPPSTAQPAAEAAQPAQPAAESQAASEPAPQVPPAAGAEPATTAPAEQAQAPGAREEALKNDPNVQQSQQPEPAAQGTRSPEPLPSPTETPTLTQALEAVWRTPTDLDGNPLPAAAPEGEANPAAHTAAGCATTDAQLTQTPPGSTPCPDPGADPKPGDGSAR
jgi:hypothetical protein